MNKAAVYVFRDALCKKLGFTMMSRYFPSVAEAEAYAKGFKFTNVVKF